MEDRKVNELPQQKRKHEEEEQMLKEDYSREDASPPKKQKTKLFNPSTATWLQLVDENIVKNFNDFKGEVKRCQVGKNTLTETCRGEEQIIDKIKNKVDKDNEGFPMLYCGCELVHIADHLGDDYRVKVLPVVFEVPDDGRQNKKSDYTIIRVNNKRTVVVVELKSEVSTKLEENEKELAQLFLEVHYSVEPDKKRCDYDRTIAILGDSKTWHVFILNVSAGSPYSVSEYYLLDSDLSDSDNVKLGRKCALIKKKVEEMEQVKNPPN
jgi:hypothetical protein